ncbi:MAG: HD domain-containing protein [Clostridia bacterium]|nr:HD domain-containing protein [Clostridia bacterium]
MDEKRLKQQLDFILEIDKEKNIFRQTHLTGYTRRENDAEHAWHMAIMIYLLREYADEDFDVMRAMMMALIHDIVEIDAGDTYAYDEVNLATQKEREDAASERIFGILPTEQKNELRELFREFEEGNTPEARFARAMDNLQPLLLNDSNGGVDWRVHGVTRTQVTSRQKRTLGASKVLWDFTHRLIDKNVEAGNIKPE